ncbi:hypothetical protein [Rhodoferax sp.]|uniref:hypothetical protein n=1 Tax=Rhodoferax sp. TaxID=50421 RepID=UPI00277A4052|nr:hypothetical protein [Rhodoferax sp.]
MTIFSVPETLEGAYRGAGMALAASNEGRLLALKYLCDLLPDVDSLECDASGQVDAGILDHPRLAPAVRELRALGEVHLGVCCGWEFMVVAGAQ